MDFRIFQAFAALPAKAKLAFYTAVGFALLLVLAGKGYAEDPSAASLKGSYAFQLGTPKLAYWSNSKKCKINGSDQTVYASNSATITELVYGVATFDGEGHVSLTFTDIGNINQDASNATISITCANGGSTNTGGSIVYEAPETGAASGTYKVESNGSGSMTISITSSSSGSSDDGGSATFDLQLAGFGSNGVASTALLRASEGENDQRWGFGTAVHE